MTNGEGCNVELAKYDGASPGIVNRGIFKQQRFSLSGQVGKSDFYEIDIVGAKANYQIPVYLDSNAIHVKARYNYLHSRLPRYPMVQSNGSVQKELNRYMVLRDSPYDLFYLRLKTLIDRFEQSMTLNDSVM